MVAYISHEIFAQDEILNIEFIDEANDTDQASNCTCSRYVQSEPHYNEHYMIYDLAF